MNATSISEFTALATGIAKYCPNTVFTIDSQTFTSPEAVTFVTNLLTIVSAASTAKTNWQKARPAALVATAANGEVVKGLRESVKLMFGNDPTTLAAFQIAPEKPRAPLSAEQLAARNAKAQATRLARGTKSKKQAAAIAGNVTGVTITPVKAGAVSAPSVSTTTTATVGLATVTPAPVATNGAAGAASTAPHA